MNSTNYERGSRVLKVYWFKRTRNFIATQLLKLGSSFGRWAERAALRIAPWIDP